MFSLSYGNKKYSAQDIIASVLEDEIIQFCKAWLRGEELFKLKTSGSTGKPKEILLTRDVMEFSAAMTGEALGIMAGQDALLCLSPSHVAGKMMLVRGMHLGLNVVCVEPSLNPLKELNQSIDFAAMVPAQLRTVLKQCPEKLSLIKKLIIGGAPLSYSDIDELKNIDTECFATYGMTETVSHIALQCLNGTNAQSYFQLVPGVVISKDERGCLVIKGVVTNGQELVTNDLVDLVDYDSFIWKGRLDNIINSGGIKIIAEEVEKSLDHLFFDLKIKNRFVVSSFNDPVLGEKVGLIIEGEPFELSFTHYEEYFKKYHQPKEVKFVTHFPFLASGKVDKQTLLRGI